MGESRMRTWNKKKMGILLIAAAFLCTGCGNQGAENGKNNEATEAISEAEAEGKTGSQGQKLTVPTTQQEHDELFGKTDSSGKWTPPKDSYTDPKTGNIYNKEGVVIGGPRPTKPVPGAVG